MPTCEPVYYKKDMGKAFCKNEFFKFVERMFVRAIKRYKMIKRGDRVAVAVSGGKDSMALLYLMDKIERKNFDVDLVVVHLDEGIKGYSDRAAPLVRRYCKELGVEYLEASYADLFKYTIDRVSSLEKDFRAYEPCSYCGVWRRWGLNYLALKANADKLATAHTMDDEAQTVIINVLRGGFKNLIRQDIYPNRKEGLVPRIKPLRLLLEKETALYTTLKNIPYVDTTCPYAHLGMRWAVRFWLYEIEEEYPGSIRNALGFLENLISLAENLEKGEEIGRCEICGFPSNDTLCRAHQLMKLLDDKLKSK